MDAETRKPEKGGKLELEDRAKWLLLIGVLSSVSVIVFGLVLFAVHPGDRDPMALQNDVLSLGKIPSGLAKLDAVAFIDLGVIMLIATPVLRVIIVTETLIENKEWKFVAVGVIVLVVIFTSFVIAGLNF